MDPDYLSYLWKFLVFGYLMTIALETPVLAIGLSPRHPMRHRIFAGVWLTACTYPIVVLVLPQLIDTETNRVLYLAVAETFAPVAECALFWAAFGKREEWLKKSMWRDLGVVVLANLLSFGQGELAHSMHWFDPFVPPPAPSAIPEGDGEALRGRPGGGEPKDSNRIVEGTLSTFVPAEAPSRRSLQISKVLTLGMRRPTLRLE